MVDRCEKDKWSVTERGLNPFTTHNLIIDEKGYPMAFTPQPPVKPKFAARLKQAEID
jgi:hypothetical protein